MARRAMLWIAAALAGYAALTLVACAAQRAVLFPAPRGSREPLLRDAALERIAAPDGSTVLALHAPAPPGAPTVVHFHGNGEQLADVVHLAAALRAAGVGVYAVEYPGYGLAAGSPSEHALYAAAEAALAHLQGKLGVPAGSVVLQGHSLGSGVATEMAARGHGARLMLLSPFTSIVDLASRYAPILPARVYVRDRFDSASKAARVSIPVLVVHGTEDEIIPVEHGRRLAGLFPSARLEELPGRHHNDLFAEPGAPLVERLARFAREGQ